MASTTAGVEATFVVVLVACLIARSTGVAPNATALGVTVAATASGYLVDRVLDVRALRLRFNAQTRGGGVVLGFAPQGRAAAARSGLDVAA